MKVYGIVYGDKTTPFIPIRNDRPWKPWRFENEVMLRVAGSLNKVPEDEFVGVLSWKFEKKTGITKERLERAAASAPNDVEVINCSRWRSHLHFMDWSDEGHAGIRDMIKRCCAHVGLKYNDDPVHIIFANQFIARKFVYLRYTNEVIGPCLELLEGEMWDEVNRPAGYTAGLELQELKKLTGLTFYNYVPFILERMAMQFVSHHGIKTIEL